MKAVLALGIVCIAVALVNAEGSDEPDTRQGFVVPVPAQQSVVAQPGFPVLGLAQQQQQQQQQMMQTIMLLFLIRRLRNRNDDDDNDDDDDETCVNSDWYKARNGCYYRRFFSTPRSYEDSKTYCRTQCGSEIATSGMRDNFVIKGEILNAVNFKDTGPGVWIGVKETSLTSNEYLWDDGVPSTVYIATTGENGNTNWDQAGPPEPVTADTVVSCAFVDITQAENAALFSTADCAALHPVVCELCM